MASPTSCNSKPLEMEFAQEFMAIKVAFAYYLMVFWRTCHDPFEGVQRVKSQVKIAVGFSEKMARLEILLVFSQVAEARIGRLSSSQREFTTIRSKKNSLIELDKKWNGEEDPLLRRLQTKLFHSKRNMSDYDDRLLIKPKSSAKSVAERESDQVQSISREEERPNWR